MNKKYAVYCSGNANRILKFYQTHSIVDYPISFVFYDGEKDDIYDKLTLIFENVISFKWNNDLKSKALNEAISQALLDKLYELNIDYVFCFGDKILTSNLVNAYKNRIINFHPSILPAFPGLNAIDKALKSSVQVLGNTAHFIDIFIDNGPIILQSIISRSSYNHYDDVLDLQIPMLKKIWDYLDNDKIKVKKGKVIIDDISQNQIFFSI